MLGLRAAHATLWSLADVVLRQGFQFGISILLARLLAPEEFGAFAIVMLFTSLAGVLVDAGFSAALVQRQDATHRDESTVFWFNLCAAAVASGVLVATAQPIADFFRAPQLVTVIMAMSLIVLINAAAAVQNALFAKTLDLRTPALVGGVSVLASGAAAAALAFAGAGIWALVGQALVSALAATAGTWWLSPWRPKFAFSWTTFRSYSRFGLFTASISVLEVVDARLSAVLLGRLYSPRDLGYFVRADSTAQLPTSIIKRVAARVALSVFAQAATDADQLSRAVRRTTRSLALIAFPVAIGMAATAEHTIVTLFGERWAPTAPLLSILALGAVIVPHYIVASNMILARGHSHILFWIFLAKRAVSIALLIGSARWGPLGIAWGVIAGAAVGVLMDTVTVDRLARYRPSEQVADLAPIAMAAAIMGACVWVIGQLALPSPVVLGVQIVAGAAVYAALCWATRIAAFADVLATVKQLAARPLRTSE